jgi:hypothetical protein
MRPSLAQSPFLVRIGSTCRASLGLQIKTRRRLDGVRAETLRHRAHGLGDPWICQRKSGKFCAPRRRLPAYSAVTINGACCEMRRYPTLLYDSPTKTGAQLACPTSLIMLSPGKIGGRYLHEHLKSMGNPELCPAVSAPAGSRRLMRITR